MSSTSSRQIALRIAVIGLMVLSSGVGGASPMALSASAEATFTYSPDIPVAGESVSFDARASYSEGSTVEEYEWEVTAPEGTTSRYTGSTVNISFASDGQYRIRLDITDSSGGTSSAERSISVIPDQIHTSDDNPRIAGERGAYRLLSNNDIRENVSENFTDTYQVPTAVFEQREADTDLPLVRIDGRSFTIAQARQYGLLTDTYRENLYGPVRIPTENSTVPYNDVEVLDTYFLGFNVNETHGQFTNASRRIWVRTDSSLGWREVRNAKVLRKNESADTLGPLYIDNKGDAEVFDGSPISYEEFNNQVVEETFSSTGPDASQVVMSDGSPRYSLSTASVEGEWQSEQDVIVDHYAATARITEGALYDDFWLVNPAGFDATVLRDFRLETPPDYTQEVGCTFVRDNETQYGTNERWERWERVSYSDDVSLYHGGQFHEASSGGNTISIDSPVEGGLRPYSDVQVKLKHTYGVDSSCPSQSWSESETVTVSDTYNATWHNIKPVSADGLNITVYLRENPYSTELVYDIEGNQRPDVNPLDKITFSASGPEVYSKTATLRMPWTFISQSLYNEVERREADSTSTRAVSTRANASLNSIHRDYLDGNRYKMSNQGNISLFATFADQTQTFEGVGMGPYVNSTTGDVPLYRTIRGEMYRIPGNGTLNNPTATATDIFGNDVEVDVVRREYQSSAIERSIDGRTITAQLVDSEGNGIANRTIDLSGAVREEVITDGNGEFTVEIDDNATSTSLTFNGDHVRETREMYYDDSKATTLNTINFIAQLVQPIDYLNRMISNLMIFAEWMALGLFIIWWVRFRDQDPRKN